MLQRAQTVYLLLAAALLVVFVTLGDVWAAGAGSSVAWLGPVAYGLAALTAVIALVAIGLFKDRARQRQLVGAAQWVDLALVLAVLVGIAATPVAAEAAGEATSADYGRYLVGLTPLVVYVLLRMARRGVDRDIATVRSMDRIR